MAKASVGTASTAKKKATTKSTKASSARKVAGEKTAASETATSVAQLPPDVVTIDRRSGKDRRSGQDRRKQQIPVAVERRQGERRKVQRRRLIDPTTCERDYTPEEIEFMIALDNYKRASGRMFPTCSEILEVLRNLGYRKCTCGSPAPAEPASSTSDGLPAGSSPEAKSET